jgi:tRNA-splicing ligase RtcB (3'-phosphate/5'-hydroxy nucleic acid ligase)
MTIRKINDWTWEIPREGDMRVPARIYASAGLLEAAKKDLTLQQARNVACLPGIQRMSYVMPDAHQGYGFPIGGVAAFDTEDGVISPGGVGYDINCGVRLLRTDFTEEEIAPKKKDLMAGIFRDVPSGVGKGGEKIGRGVLRDILTRGAAWAVAEGYGTKNDLERTEERGRMMDADPDALSDKALERGLPQLGTLGAGNHFLEIQKVDHIFDEAAARAFGLEEEGRICVMIHCGSRGLGHQVASDYIEIMKDARGVEGLPDRELVNAPFRSALGRRYYGAMCAAVNYAFANRQMIAHRVRNVFARVLGSAEGMDLVYDVCHNVAKVERHRVAGGLEKELCVHRKGATRSFGPGRPEIPAVYQASGQPVLIPGSMGTSSYVLAGTREAEALSFGSTAHGAGRRMSRHEALRRFRGERIRDDLARKGILLFSTSWKGVAEEASEAYKDVDDVVKVSHEAGLGRLVARVVPVAVMKG